MIKSLEIQNFALIEKLSVEFQTGLNILTGETGAGKTIIVSALSQLCGGRSSPEMVGTGSKKAVIEAEFDTAALSEFNKILDDIGIEAMDSDNLILRKEIGVNGKTRIFINDSPVNLAQLNQVSSNLIDLHGQHQHQKLLHPENHIYYLDEFGGLNETVQQYSALFFNYKKELNELESLKSRQLNSFQKQDMYRFQYDELKKASLEADELEQLKKELKKLGSVESLHQFAGEAGGLLYSGESNAGEIITKAEDSLRELAKLDDQFQPLLENLLSARDTIEEIGRFTEEYSSQLQFDPDRMEEIHQRIARLEFLLKKYQKTSIADLISLHEEIEQELNFTEQFDEEIQKKERLLAELRSEVLGTAAAISTARKQQAVLFEERITNILKEIGMNRARFNVMQTEKLQSGSKFEADGKFLAIDERGFDQVIFEIDSNGTNELKPIHKTASGGEISRIMLALKSVLAENDQTPVLVFDEIDSGVSGKTAQSVGRKMRNLSKFHQILCVTHLPQIAAFADSHYKVLKFTEDSRTLVDISLLDRQGQIDEIANLLGGRRISEHALQNARHLIDEASELQL